MFSTISKAVLAAAMAAAGSMAVAPPPARASTTCRLPVFGPGASYRPHIRPGNFSPDVTNPFFPLRVGRTYVYTGVKDGKHAIDLVIASPRTRTLDGVRTRIV